MRRKREMRNGECRTRPILQAPPVVFALSLHFAFSQFPRCLFESHRRTPREGNLAMSLCVRFLLMFLLATLTTGAARAAASAQSAPAAASSAAAGIATAGVRET